MPQKEFFPISKGPSECFLIHDDDLGMNTTFFKYLKSEGFSHANPNPGNSDSKHCYVNITRRQYAFGKAGVQLGFPIGNASITIREFRTIWNIYKKHLKAGECFDCRDVPFIYQSKNVREHRQKYEEDRRRMEEIRKKAKPATPEEVEALVKEFPAVSGMIRGLAAKGETASVIRGCAEVSEWF